MKSLLLATALLCLSSPAFAFKAEAADLMVHDAKAFETSEGMKHGAALLTIMNHGDADDKLVSVSTPITPRAEIHEMSETNGVMKMRKVDGITIGAGKTVTFSPDGYHVMLMDLKTPLKAGTEFPLTLQFEKAGKIETNVEVVSRSAKKEETAPHDMDHMDH